MEPVDDQESMKIIDMAIDLGINLFDTAEIRTNMAELVEGGIVRWYDWSTDRPHQLKVFLKGEHCTATEQDFNIFPDKAETLTMCEGNNLASLNRRPLACGALTENSRLGSGSAVSGGGEEIQKKLAAVRENCEALTFEPLNQTQMDEIELIKKGA
ncbi:MAG TPA: hypothetical protein ENI27_03015 [bacterium]|nr:hypothetical protein [bacterium]